MVIKRAGRVLRSRLVIEFVRNNADGPEGQRDLVLGIATKQQKDAEWKVLKKRLKVK